MDCDLVFAALTRAPFPTGAPSDADVERHLLGCAGCRRIAEALRPTSSLQHEQLAPAERRALPRYRTELAPAAVGSPTGGQTGGHLADDGHAAYPLPVHNPSWGWRTGAMAPQLAMYVLPSPTRNHWVWDLAALLFLGLAVSMGVWGIGWLVL